MNEKNDNASCLSEEPLISADQVFKGIFENTCVCEHISSSLCFIGVFTFLFFVIFFSLLFFLIVQGH